MIVHIWSSVMNHSVDNKDISFNRTKTERAKHKYKNRHQTKTSKISLDKATLLIASWQPTLLFLSPRFTGLIIFVWFFFAICVIISYLTPWTTKLSIIYLISHCLFYVIYAFFAGVSFLRRLGQAGLMLAAVCYTKYSMFRFCLYTVHFRLCVYNFSCNLFS